MEKKKHLRDRRRTRCSTEPPLPLVCSQTLGDTDLPSPDLLNVTWTWDARGPRRPRTLKRHPTVRATMRKRPQFHRRRKPRPSATKPETASLTKLSRTSHCSSSQSSSQYFDALLDNTLSESLDEDWPNELEYFCDAHDDMNQVRLYEQRRYDTITKNYAHLYRRNSRNSAHSKKDCDSFKNVYTKIDDDVRPFTTTNICRSSPDPIDQWQTCRESEPKSKSTSYLNAVARAFHWTLRKSDEVFSSPRKEARVNSSEDIMGKGFTSQRQDGVLLRDMNSHTLPRYGKSKQMKQEQTYSTLPRVKQSSPTKYYNNDVKRFVKDFCKKILDRRRKPKDVDDLHFYNSSYNNEVNSFMSLLDSTSATEVKISRKHTLRKINNISNGPNVIRRSKSNGWKNKYKQTAWYTTGLESDPFNENRRNIEPQDSGCIADIRRNSSLDTTTGDSVLPRRGNTPLRDKVELFDILSSDGQDGSNVSPSQSPCRVVITNCDSLSGDIGVNQSTADKTKTRKFPAITPPHSPLLRKLLVPFREASLVSSPELLSFH